MGLKGNHELINSLEDLLVKEFRVLQNLISVSQNERVALTTGDTDQIIKLVEEKEAILDQVSLLEDERRNLTAKLMLEMGIDDPDLSMEVVFRKSGKEASQRLARLNDGIMTLAAQARDISEWNKAYAVSTLDWLSATQNYMLKLVEPQIGYQGNGAASVSDVPVSLDINHQA
jgi:flagellar biosynthesis/type III secretory pathway chaperone